MKIQHSHKQIILFRGKRKKQCGTVQRNGLLFHLFSFLFDSSEFWNFLPTAVVNILLDLYLIPFFGGESEK